MKINKLLESKKIKEEISSTEPVVKFQGKSSHTFTKDKKWEVDFDEAGNILARTRHGKTSYFKGHINDKVNDFPSTDEDNIILAAREQHGLKFGNKEEVKEGYSHFEFTSGANPYIAKTKAEVDRIKRSRGDSVKYVGNINGIDYYKVDDSEKDLFRVDDLDEGSIPRNALKIRATDRMNKKSIDLYKHNKYWKDSEGEDYNLYDPAYLRKWNDIEVLETDPNYKPNRTKPEYVVQGNYGYGWEDLTASDDYSEARNDLKAYRENETGVPHRLITRRVPVTENLKEAFKPSNSGIQSVKCYNQYNYTIQELRVDNDNKTFERGNFTMGKPDKKVKNRQEFEDIVDILKELGYTEIKSDYRSLRNKTRKGIPTNESLKVGDKVFVTVNKKNGVVKKVNGDYIDVETDDGKYPVRIDTYYANEVKKLDESTSVKTFGAKGKKLNEDTDAWLLVKNSNWYDPEGLGIEPPQNIICQGTKEECTREFNKIVADAKKEDGSRWVSIEELSDTHIKIYYPMAVSKAIYQLIPDTRNESLSESTSTAFKVGDTFDYTGLYGGTQHCKVINVTDDYIECKVNWTSEDDGKDVSDTSKFNLETGGGGKQCAIVWEYQGEKGRVYPNDAINESALSISDLKAFYNTSTSIDKEKYPNFFEWYDDMIRSGRFKLESMNEASNGFQKEFYNDYVILKNRAGDGYDIYSYDGTPEKVIKAFLEDEGYATMKDAKAAIDKWSKIEEDTAISSNYEFDDNVDDLTYYYDDEVFKSNLENSPYTEIASKSVPDSDGFYTDYTMYMNVNTGEYVFVFGDKDIYSPDDGNFDWECDTKEEAEEWFNSYNGFDESDEDDLDWLSEDTTPQSPIIHKKSDGSYMVANEKGDGYVAYNKDDDCVGNITANNENEAKNKFNSNQFDE